MTTRNRPYQSDQAALTSVVMCRSACPDSPTLRHLYDDDWPWPDQADMRALAPGSRVGDPCIWCCHEKEADE